MRRRLVLVLCCASLLSACGFSPVYKKEEDARAVQDVLRAVSVSSIPNRWGQKLKNHLIDRLGSRRDKADYVLDIALEENEIDLGFQKDATTTRKQLRLKASFVLKDAHGAVALKGTAASLVSYNKLAAQYGTVAAQENAESRSVKEVSEQILNRLSLFFLNEKKNAVDSHKEEEGGVGFLQDISAVSVQD